MREFAFASQIVRWLVTIEVRDIRDTQSRPPDKGKNADRTAQSHRKKTNRSALASQIGLRKKGNRIAGALSFLLCRRANLWSKKT
jgi:hypothetical protein